MNDEDAELGLPSRTLALVARLGRPFGFDRKQARSLVDWEFVRRGTAAGDGGLLVRLDGALQVDVISGDRAAWNHLLDASDPSSVSVEDLAVTAQLMRLPVTPYRRVRWTGARPPDVASAADLRTLSGLRVLDFTSTWAGPLAARLLMSAGACVTRVLAPNRPDNLRIGAPDLYEFLHPPGGAHEVALDLREDIETVRAMLAETDVVIESFSRRVLPNFGLGPEEIRDLNPRLLQVAMPAFPSGCPEQNWVAFGSGVHAITGLGFSPDRGFWTPSIAYPDPIAGLTAANRIARWFGRATGSRTGGRIESTLLAAVRPLCP